MSETERWLLPSGIEMLRLEKVNAPGFDFYVRRWRCSEVYRITKEEFDALLPLGVKQ